MHGDHAFSILVYHLHAWIFVQYDINLWDLISLHHHLHHKQNSKLKKTSILMDYTKFRESTENNSKEAKVEDLESTLLNTQSIMNSSKANTSTMVLSGSTNNFAPKLSIKLQETNFLIYNQQVEGVNLSHKLHTVLVNPHIPPMFKIENNWLENTIWKLWILDRAKSSIVHMASLHNQACIWIMG